MVHRTDLFCRKYESIMRNSTASYSVSLALLKRNKQKLSRRGIIHFERGRELNGIGYQVAPLKSPHIKFLTETKISTEQYHHFSSHLPVFSANLAEKLEDFLKVVLRIC